MASKEVPQHLLLLGEVLLFPPPAQAVYDAYRDPFTAALRDLSSKIKQGSSTGVVLDVAVACPLPDDHSNISRVTLYQPVQSFLASLYRIACSVAAKEDINVEDSDGIDIRVFLLSYADETDSHHAQLNHMGPIVDLTTLAKSRRPWQTVITTDDAPGNRLLSKFLDHQDVQIQVQKVKGGQPHPSRPPQLSAFDSHEADKKHQAVAIGGTWDHVHLGHKLLLTMFAFLAQEDEKSPNTMLSFTIGTTGDELLKTKKHQEVLQSWSERQAAVVAFIKGILDFHPKGDSMIEAKETNNPGPNGHMVRYTAHNIYEIKMVEIADQFGPTITDKAISALVTSAETSSGGRAVNEKRAQQGWPALELFEVDVMDPSEGSSGGQDFASKLSSTSIREKMMNRRAGRNKT